MQRRRGFTLIELLCVVAFIAIVAAIGVPNFLEAQNRSKIARVRSDMAILNAAIRAYSAQYDVCPPNRPECLDRLREYRHQVPLKLEKPDLEKPDPKVKTIPAMREVKSASTESSSQSAMILPPPGFPRERKVEQGEMKDPLVTDSGWDLARLTTPVAWLADSLPIDPFRPSSSLTSYNKREDIPPKPFVYLNLYPVLHEDKATTTVNRVKGYVLLSYGPDKSLILSNPALGPFIEYDPTNGTTSAGDLLSTGW